MRRPARAIAWPGRSAAAWWALVEKAGLQRNGARWLEKVSAQVVAALSDGREMTFAELRGEVPLLDGAVTYGEGKAWGGQMPIGPRVLTVLSAAGAVVRATNAGALDHVAAALGGDVGLARRADRAALRGGRHGRTRRGVAARVRPGDGRRHRVVARLDADGGPPRAGRGEGGGRRSRRTRRLRDAGRSGRRRRRWRRGSRCCRPSIPPPWAGRSATGIWARTSASVFDTNGNAGATIWCDGRIVGGWRQDGCGEVEVQLLEDVGREARRAIDAEAARLTGWLAGARVQPRFPSPLCRRRGQRKRHDAVVGHRIAEEAAARRRDDDVLPAVRPR